MGDLGDQYFKSDIGAGRVWELGELTYGYAKEEGFEEGGIRNEIIEDISIVGDVDEDDERIFSYGLGWMNE